MEKITNEQKAREICGCGNCHHNFKGSECLKYTGILCCLKPCFKATLEAMEWKDEQHKQEKQQLIDKACEWLKGNTDMWIGFIDGFKKALKDD